jgi:hypothetical protein
VVCLITGQQRRTWAPGASDGGDAAVRGETGDQTGQESRSAGHGAAASVTVMDITSHASFLPHDDPDASVAFCRATLAFGVGPAGQPGTSISGLPARL